MLSCSPVYAHCPRLQPQNTSPVWLPLITQFMSANHDLCLMEEIWFMYHIATWSIKNKMRPNFIFLRKKQLINLATFYLSGQENRVK